MHIFYKLDVLKNIVKCWSHSLIKLQVLRPETKRRGSSTCILLKILCYFLKNLIYRTLPDHCSCWFLGSKVLSIDHIFFVFSFIFFSFIIDKWNYGSLFRKGIKMKIFLLFTIIYPKMKMNVVKIMSLWQ